MTSKSAMGVALAGLFLGLLPAGHARAEAKTLARGDDPVVMECRDCAPLFESPPDRLALMAWNNAWSPVPFQIDQKKPDGTYAFDQGPMASADPDPDLDANDELAFMARDTADRAPGPALQSLGGPAVEIRVKDPKNGALGFVYLVRFAGKAPRSPVDYLRYSVDQATGRWRVVTIQYVMEGREDYTFPDLLEKNISGDLAATRVGPDVLDRIKIRGKLHGPLDITVDLPLDRIMRARTPAWIDGPVRVLQASDSYFEVSSLISMKGAGRVVVVYYFNHVIWPMHMEVPNLGFILKKVDMAAYMDFSPAVFGSHVFSDVNPYNDAVVLDGRMDDAEKNLVLDRPTNWVAGWGEQGAMMCRVFFPQEWSAVQILPFYLDDAAKSDMPEDDPGVSAPGFRFVGFEKLGALSGTYYQYFYFKDEITPDNVGGLLDILDHPLQTRVDVIGGE